MPKISNRNVDTRLEFGQRLRELRQTLSYTQAELAYTLGIQPARYNKYEIGRSEAPYQLLIRLAKQFNADIHYLVSGEKREALADDQNIPVALIQAIDALPTPAAIYDGNGKLVTSNDLYVETFFQENPGIVKPGTPHEFLIRTWAYSCGMDANNAEAFVRARLSFDPSKFRSFRFDIGLRSLCVSEIIHKDYRFVLVMDLSPGSSAQL